MRRQNGLAYVGILLLLAVIGITAGAAAEVWVTTRQRQKEAELLWVGNQIRTAILSYSGGAPGGVPSYPMRLEDLLQDNRSAGLRRHLRKIYIDPMTGKADWVLMPAPQGGIAGVHSRSTATPLKQTGFRPRDMIFENKSSYTEWQFSALPPMPTAPPPGSQPGGLPSPPPPPPPPDGR